MKRRLLLPVIVCATALFASRANAQDIRGRVVDERSRQGIRDAVVTLLDAEGGVRAEATTDDAGFFRLRAPDVATYTLVVVQAGFAEHREEVRVRAGERAIPAVVLKAQAVALDPIEVEASAQGRRPGEPEVGGFQRASHILAGEQLATLESHGGNLMTAVKRMGSLRTREFKGADGRDHRCVESLRAAPTGLQIGGTGLAGASGLNAAACQWVAIVIDGLMVGGEPERVFREVQYLGDYESVEYMPPAEAGRLYGMDAAAVGALVLWTRGRGPHVSDARNR